MNRIELDRQHLADIDLMVAVGSDGTVLSADHFLDHVLILILSVNSVAFMNAVADISSTASNEAAESAGLAMEDEYALNAKTESI